MNFLETAASEQRVRVKNGQEHCASIPMAKLPEEFGVSLNTLSRWLKKLDIITERRGNFRYLTEDQYQQVFRLSKHLRQNREFKSFDTKMDTPLDSVSLSTSDQSSMNDELISLADWIAETEGISRSAAYEIFKIIGLEPIKLRAPGSRSASSYLNAEQRNQMDQIAVGIRQGMTMTMLRDNYQITNIADQCKTSDRFEKPLRDNPWGLSLSNCEERWGICRNSVKARSRYLRVKIERPNSKSSYWPWDYLHLGDELNSWLEKGNPMKGFSCPAIEDSILDSPLESDDPSSEPLCYVHVWGEPTERLVAHRNDDRIFSLDAGSSSWVELPRLPL